jgi:hypothetical protein
VNSAEKFTALKMRGVILSRSSAEAKNLMFAVTLRFFVAEFILSAVEGLLRMTSRKITWTEY